MSWYAIVKSQATKIDAIKAMIAASEEGGEK